MSLLSYQFKSYQPAVALNLLQKRKALLDTGDEDTPATADKSKSMF